MKRARRIRVPVYVEHDSHGIYTVSCFATDFPTILFSLRDWMRSDAKRIRPVQPRRRARKKA